MTRQQAVKLSPQSNFINQDNEQGIASVFLTFFRKIVGSVIPKTIIQQNPETLKSLFFTCQESFELSESV